MKLTFLKTCHLIRADLRQRSLYDGLRPGFWSCFRELCAPPGMAVVVMRLENYCHSLHLGPCTKLLELVNLCLFTTEIRAGAEIEEGLVLGSANGVMVDHRARIGRNCILMHQCSIAVEPRLGADPINDRVVLEDEVVVGPGVRVLGNIVIGHHSRICGNSLVTKSAPPGSILEGGPARVAGTVEGLAGPAGAEARA